MGRTADWFLRFAEQDADGRSASYAEQARGVAGDPEVLARLDRLPLSKRQPALVFGVARLLGAPTGWPAWRRWFLAHADTFAEEVARRTTQTNDPVRCAALLPALAQLGGPLELYEIGASAGLCLYPDRYAYRYDSGAVLGESELLLECDTAGTAPTPRALPRIVRRVAVDIHPLSVRDDADLRWLEALVWPEEHARLQRLRAACRIAAADPPELVAADAVAALEDWPRFAAGALGSPVLVTSGVLVYLSVEQRTRFAELAGATGAAWVALEAPHVIPGVAERLPAPPPPDAPFVLSLDGRPLAFTAAHGQRVRWLD